MPREGCGCAYQKVQAEHVQEGSQGGAPEKESCQSCQEWSATHAYHTALSAQLHTLPSTSSGMSYCCTVILWLQMDCSLECECAKTCSPDLHVVPAFKSSFCIFVLVCASHAACCVAGSPFLACTTTIVDLQSQLQWPFANARQPSAICQMQTRQQQTPVAHRIRVISHPGTHCHLLRLL